MPHCTVIVKVAVLRPNSFVAFSVYVVVCEGVTTTLLPRTAPTCGVTSKYEAPVTFHDNVTFAPAETVVGLAEKLAITGTAPVGRLDCV